MATLATAQTELSWAGAGLRLTNIYFELWSGKNFRNFWTVGPILVIQKAKLVKI